MRALSTVSNPRHLACRQELHCCQASVTLLGTVTHRSHTHSRHYGHRVCTQAQAASRAEGMQHVLWCPTYIYIYIYVYVCVCVWSKSTFYFSQKYKHTIQIFSVVADIACWCDVLLQVLNIYFCPLLYCKKKRDCTLAAVHVWWFLCDIWGDACKVWDTSEKQGQVTKDEVTYPFSANSVFLNHGRHSRAFGTEFQDKFSLLWVTRCLPSACVYAHSRMLEFPHYLVR